MNWYALKNNKCPQCNSSLAQAYEPDMKMFVCPCGFKVTPEKFQSIVSDMTNQDIKRVKNTEDDIGEEDDENEYD